MKKKPDPLKAYRDALEAQQQAAAVVWAREDELAVATKAKDAAVDALAVATAAAEAAHAVLCQAIADKEA